MPDTTRDLEAEAEMSAGLDEMDAPAPDEAPGELPFFHDRSLESQHTGQRLEQSNSQERVTTEETQRDYEAEKDGTAGLDEIDAPAPDQNPGDSPIYRHRSLESQRTGEHCVRSESRITWKATLQIQAHITGYLVFFSILGVLGRLGLVALTTFPGAPLAITALWANVAGSFIMGFLREDRTFFRRHRRAFPERNSSLQTRTSGSHQEDFDATRKTMHSYIGLTVGFCGTMTSFADIVRDFFFAISYSLDSKSISTQQDSGVLRPRNDGYSILAGIGVLWLQIAMSISSLIFGAHIAIAMQPLADHLPYASSLRNTIDRLMLVVGYGIWIGAICFIIWTPEEKWRDVLLAVVFAPCGAVARYLLSRTFNPKFKSFPLGTFLANVLGTCVLATVLDLQHTHTGQLLSSCQILQGIADGFCGGLTTVSTWVLELDGLARRHAYLYAIVSVGVAASCMVAISGPVRWTQHPWEAQCQ